MSVQDASLQPLEDNQIYFEKANVIEKENVVLEEVSIAECAKYSRPIDFKSDGSKTDAEIEAAGLNTYVYYAWRTQDTQDYHVNSNCIGKGKGNSVLKIGGYNSEFLGVRYSTEINKLYSQVAAVTDAAANLEAFMADVALQKQTKKNADKFATERVKKGRAALRQAKIDAKPFIDSHIEFVGGVICSFAGLKISDDPIGGARSCLDACFKSQLAANNIERCAPVDLDWLKSGHTEFFQLRTADATAISTKLLAVFGSCGYSCVTCDMHHDQFGLSNVCD